MTTYEGKPMSSNDILDRAKAALEGVTPGPWEHHIAPHGESDETPAEYMAGCLAGNGEPLHVLTAVSPNPQYAYIVPALTGDGPASAVNADFIAQARELVPELIAEVEKLRRAAKTLGKIIDDSLTDVARATDSLDLLGEDHDGDWMLIFERLAELRPQRDAARVEVEMLKAKVERLESDANRRLVFPAVEGLEITDRGVAIVESGLSLRHAHEIKTGCSEQNPCAECRSYL